jgi:hypothetical protein
MAWAAVVLGIIFAVSSIVVISMIALRMLQTSRAVSHEFVEAHRDTLGALERIHERNVGQINGVLDRFMALDFSLFKAYQSSETADVGGFILPDEEEEGVSGHFNAGGRFIDHSANITQRMRAVAEEEKIIAEDFDEEFFRREDEK